MKNSIINLFNRTPRRAPLPQKGRKAGYVAENAGP
jgi:hypothetical protein